MLQARMSSLGQVVVDRDAGLVRPEPSPREDPLAELAKLARAGDRDALRRLFGGLAPRVLQVVRGVMGPDNADVEDIAQNSLVGVLQALPSFRGESLLVYFAVRIATRTAVAARRRTRRHDSAREPLEQWETSAPLGPYASGGGQASDSPHGGLVRDKCREVWQRLLDELPEAQTETIVLRILLDYSLEETAAATGVPVNTVRSRIRLAREAMRRRILSDPGLADLLIREQP
jgi:RNA polymerase sigma-70 factor (ECF subfamily)